MSWSMVWPNHDRVVLSDVWSAACSENRFVPSQRSRQPSHCFTRMPPPAMYCPLQESLGLADRVRFAGAYMTAPCLMKVGLPKADGGCNRTFVSSQFSTGPPTSPALYDGEFVHSIGDYDAKLKQIPFTCAPRCGCCSLGRNRDTCCISVHRAHSTKHERGLVCVNIGAALCV
jgi:hypothetical protein